MCYLQEKRKNLRVNAVEETEKFFKYVKNKINEDKLSQVLCHIFPNQNDVNHLEILFVFYLHTYKDKKCAHSNAAGLYDVSRLRCGIGV